MEMDFTADYYRRSPVRLGNMHRPIALLIIGVLVSQAADLALVGARIYPGPDLVPLSNGTLVIHDGRIASVGANNIKVPAGMTRIDCKGLTVTAGFWNCHVHFSENKWENASSIAVATLTLQLRDMFTRWGFTSVFDTGS